MKTMKRTLALLITLALVLGPLAFLTVRPAAAEPVYTCLPTCEENDSRMLTVAGTNIQTLADENIELQIAVNASASSFELGIFDGDTNATWDSGTTILKYTLYADPLAQGDQSVLVGEWLGSEMPDNAWFNVTFPTQSEAQSPSGNYFYFLRIESTAPGTMYISNFKVRTDGLLLTFRPSPFAFIASLMKLSDIQIVYPNWPDRSVTTYDGTFVMYFYVSQSTEAFITWDGDLDFGSYDLKDLDTDDPDTPNVVPDWANPIHALPEGVAVGSNGSTGAPNDDNSIYPLYMRSPSIIYTVTDPNNNVYLNDNPSGNREWEQFVISAQDPAQFVNPREHADYYVDELLPAGVYKITLEGMDLFNLNAWRSLYPLMGVCEAGVDGNAVPCKEMLFPFIIGDTVFFDADGNGVQDPYELGIAGVLVNLLDSNGNPVLDIYGNPITAVTDANGYYQFEVEGQKISPYGEVVNDGIYTVQVDPSNFLPGGPLEGMTSTTGGETQTEMVIDASVLTYDFGYKAPVTVSPGTGTIGYWMNHPQAWPVEQITIGSVAYTKAQAIQIMKTAGGGDKTYDLFKQLVAAKLNVIIGNESSCIDAQIAAADAWLTEYPLGSKIKASSAAWKAIEDVFTALDNYNNGLLCAPHRG